MDIIFSRTVRESAANGLFSHVLCTVLDRADSTWNVVYEVNSQVRLVLCGFSSPVPGSVRRYYSP